MQSEEQQLLVFRLLDGTLIVAGVIAVAGGFSTLLASIWQFVFSWLVLPTLVAGLALAALFWFSRAAALVGVAVSAIVGAFSVLVAWYLMGLPSTLVCVCGSVALAAGSLGLSFRTSASRALRFSAIRVGLAATVALACLAFSMLTWSPQGKAVLLGLPLLAHAHPEVSTEPGGIWAAYWGVPRVAPRVALEDARTALVKDGWTIVPVDPDLPDEVDAELTVDITHERDTSTDHWPPGPHLVDARRDGWSVEILYEPDIGTDYWRTGAYMAAYVRKGSMR